MVLESPAALYVLGALTTLAALHKLWHLVKTRIVGPLTDPLANLRGPPAGRFEGQFRYLSDPRVSADRLAEWTRQYGRTFVYQKTGRHDLRLISTDFTAISHVLTQSRLYSKPPLNRSLFSHPDVVHPSFQNFASPQLNRKIMTPAFSGRSLRAMTGLYFERIEELRDQWIGILDAAAAANGNGQAKMEMNVLPDLMSTTMEIVTNACFDLTSKSEKEDESASEAREDRRKLMRGLHHLAEPMTGDIETWRRMITGLIPRGDILFPSKVVATMTSLLDDVERVGLKIIENKRQAILAEGDQAADGGGDSQVKPLLTLLVKANMYAPPNKRLGPLQVLDQVGTVMIAGGDTVAVGIAWVLHLLALHPATQSALRTALLDLPRAETDDAHLDALSSLPLFEAVLRESLRVRTPVHGIVRAALADDIIPLSVPITRADGRRVQGVEIRRGSCVHIPIEGLNLSTDLWGEDAREFRPERWLPDPWSAAPMVGGLRHPGLERVMSFSYGAYACQGYRMALNETRVMLDILLRNFVFRPVEGVEIGKYQALFTMPCVDGGKEGVWEQWRQRTSGDVRGPGLPLLVEKYEEGME